MKVRKKDKYLVEDIGLFNKQIVILIRDLETNELLEITEETLKNRSTKTDLIIYKTVMEYFYNYLIHNDKSKIYQK